MKKSKLVR